MCLNLYWVFGFNQIRVPSAYPTSVDWINWCLSTVETMNMLCVQYVIIIIFSPAGNSSFVNIYSAIGDLSTLLSLISFDITSIMLIAEGKHGT